MYPEEDPKHLMTSMRCGIDDLGLDRKQMISTAYSDIECVDSPISTPRMSGSILMASAKGWIAMWRERAVRFVPRFRVKCSEHIPIQRKGF